MDSIEIYFKENYQHLLKSAKQISNNDELAEELLHYSITSFLEKPQHKEIIDSGCATFYIVRILISSWRSSTSPFYFTYRKATESLDSENFIDKPGHDENEIDFYNKAITELDKLDWYSKAVFLEFVEDNNISELSRQSHIPRTSLSLTINRVKKHLKNKLK